MQAGKKLSLQYHDVKQETMLLLTGEAILHIGPDVEHMQAVQMVPGQGYTIHVMEVHRLEAITNTQVLECSTGEVGTTYRLQDDYSRTDEVR